MNPVIGAIVVWVLLLFLAMLVVHEVRGADWRWQLVVVDREHRLYRVALYSERGECLLVAQQYRGQAGISWADCVIAEAGI